MHIYEDTIFDGDDFKKIGFKGTNIKYSTTVLGKPDSDIKGFQLYQASVPEALFDEIQMTHVFYIAVEIPTDPNNALDLRKLRMWTISEAMGDLLIGYQSYVTSYINEQMRSKSTGESLLNYGLSYPDGMSKEDVDRLDRIAADELHFAKNDPMSRFSAK